MSKKKQKWFSLVLKGMAFFCNLIFGEFIMWKFMVCASIG